jgi:hypothetical protein
MLIKILIPNCGSPEAFISAPQNYDPSCILLLKSYSESCKQIYEEIAGKK